MTPKAFWVIGLCGAGLVLGALATGLGPLGAASGTLSPLAACVLLYAITIPLIHKVAAGHRTVERVLLIGLGLKLLGAFARYYVNVKVFGTLADSALYDEAGREIAVRLSEGFAWPSDFSYRGVGTTRLAYVTGVLYRFSGPNIVTGYVTFSWFGFLGYLMFFKGFITARPQIDRALLAKFMFFMPSLIFWPSSLGKEAWMLFGLGIATWGIARMSIGRRGLLTLGAALGGLLLGGWIRPHLPVIASVSLVGAFLWPTGKSVSRTTRIVVVGAAAALVITSLGAIGREYGTSASGLLDQANRQTDTGGSEFTPVIVSNPINLVPGVASTLFRPFLFEARSLVQIATAAELTWLLVLIIRRRRRWRELTSQFRSSVFVRFAVLYVIGFAVAFSRIANFGLLARQRAQCWPMLLFLVVVVSVPARQSGSPNFSRRNANARRGDPLGGVDELAQSGAPSVSTLDAQIGTS